MKKINICILVIYAMFLTGCVSQNELLKRAIIAKDKPSIQKAISKGADANDGMKLAIQSNNTELIKFFLSNGASSDYGLNLAYEKNDIELMKIMFGKGAKSTYQLEDITDITLVDKSTNKETSVEIIFDKYKTPQIKYDNEIYSKILPDRFYLKYKVSKKSESSFLLGAIEKGNLEMVKLLLSQQTDKNCLFALPGSIHCNLPQLLMSDAELVTSAKYGGMDVNVGGKLLMWQMKDGFVGTHYIPTPLPKSTIYDFAVKNNSKSEIIEAIKQTLQ